MTDIVENWTLYYNKCTRFTGMRLDWDNNPAFTMADALGIGHTILMLPARVLLKAFDMLQPVAKYFQITCATGVNSTDWMLASCLLWLVIIGVVLQTTGWQYKRWNKAREGEAVTSSA